MSARKPRLEWSDVDLDTGEWVIDAYVGGYRLSVYPANCSDGDDVVGSTWAITRIAKEHDLREVETVEAGSARTVLDNKLAAEDAALKLLRAAVEALEGAQREVGGG